MDIVFLVDISDKMGRTNLEKAKQFMRDFFKTSYINNNNVKVAIMGYSNSMVRIR
jgi:Mg-chelatase subunit ChlD